MMYWDSGWPWLWMTVMMVVFSGAVVFLVVAVVRCPDRHVARDSDARDNLDTRFARGDIDADEYEQRRRNLNRDTQGAGARQ